MSINFLLQFIGMNKTVKKSTGKTRTPSKPKPKVEKPTKTTNKIVVCEINTTTTTTTTATPAIENKIKTSKPTPPTPPIVSPSTSRQTSILLPNVVETTETETKSRNIQYKQTNVLSQEEKEINEALQAIVQNRGSSPLAKHVTNPKTGKSLVKIISSPNHQGKSLIIPTSSVGAQLLKSTQETKSPTPKTQIITQQLLQTLNAQQKQLLPKTTVETIETKKVPVTVQQQILQNIKNVTLLRQNSPNTIIIDDTETTPQQQEQIAHALKQKQQQVIVKQRPATLQKQTSLLGQQQQQQQISVGGKTVMTSGQTPMVAKVLTNAAGQVIGVGGLLTQAHQKQHGALQQGK